MCYQHLILAAIRLPRFSIKPHQILIYLLLTLNISQANSLADSSELRQMTQLAEYITADYSEAVVKGEIVNQEEFKEMVDFADILLTKSGLMNPDHESFAALNYQVQNLKAAVLNKQDIEIINSHTAIIQDILLKQLPDINLPNQLLAKQHLLPLYESQCSSCHGISGRGDGVLAKTLTPSPTNFSDKNRAQNRSILGLYTAISNGIEDTAMPPFKGMSEKQRWSLAFYVGSLAFSSKQQSSPHQQATFSLPDFVNQSPARLTAMNEQTNMALIAWYRNNPEYLFDKAQDPFALAKTQLLASLNAYEQHNYDQASTAAVSAYLDGFELIENSLDSRDHDLRKKIEAQMMLIRQIIKTPDSYDTLKTEVDATIALLEQAQYLVAETQLSNGTLFSVSLVIILREGLEALLVIIALTTVLIRTGRRDALKFVHYGWVTALLAGTATWVAAQSLIAISGASREVMEGVAALLAALILLYVGVWMHSKSSASQWQSYIKKHINSHLSTGTLWGIAVLAFIAVYREVFETVLFYQSLLTQAVNHQYGIIGSGFFAGILVLAAVAWGLVKYSIKLPVSKFFSFTTYLLLALAFVLMGKAMAALQEAAIISATAMPINFQIDVLGLYSTWEGIGAQIIILIIFIGIQFFPRLFKNSTTNKPIKPANLNN